MVKYVKVKNGKVTVHTTQNFSRTLKTVFKGNFYDSRDYLFAKDMDIRVFVEDLSIYNKPDTIYYYQEGELLEIFCGTVLFAKMGEEDFETLSEENVQLILNSLKRINPTQFEIYDWAEPSVLN